MVLYNINAWRTQNTAARMSTYTRQHGHITQVLLHNRHWLPMQELIEFKELRSSQYGSINSVTDPANYPRAIKATFYFHKLIPKKNQMTTLYINWSMYIIFTLIYYIKQE